MRPAIKICGLTDEASIRAINEAAADYAGFVHFPASPRHVSHARAAELKALLSSAVHSVSVLVDPDDALLSEILTIVQPDYIQLHGKETPQRVADIKKTHPGVKIIKALQVRVADDIARAKYYEASADMLLFDAKPPELSGMLPGGNGLSFDWALLQNHNFSRPWILSGGLNAENITHAIHNSGAKIIDVSSSVEHSPGVKNPLLIDAFVKATRTS